MRTQVTALFASLHARPWSLTRTLHSDNPMDIKGEIHGTATFTPCKQPNTDPSSQATPETPETAGQTMVYREEGEMPASVMGMAGLRWTKRYIWRLADSDTMSVWFAKADRDEEDYLFHQFDFVAPTAAATATSPISTTTTTAETVTAPTPPVVANVRDSSILVARGDHLCINDMYRTAYAFRVLAETGEVLSWSSRHVVKGPKKDQDIVNIYQQQL